MSTPTNATPAPSLLRRTALRLLGYDSALKIYHDVKERMREQMSFSAAVLDRMRVRVETNRHESIRIPREGACIICSNHPHGMIDGVLLLDVMLAIRPDVRILATERLSQIEELQPYLLKVSFDSSKKAFNSQTLRSTLKWLQSGGALIVFPAGEVSHFSLYSGRISDGPWSEQIGRIALKTNAAVVPAYIHGRNSYLFQAAGLLYSRLRTALLIHEFVRLGSQTIKVSFGSVLVRRQYEQHPAHYSISDFLRSRSLLLRFKSTEKRGSTDLRITAGAGIEDPVDTSILVKEIAHLPPEQLLYCRNEFQVYRAQAPQIPSMMRELGRLRELSFRLAGEGTMQSLDLDSFDSLYDHILLWNSERSELVGAYRVGRCDEILRRFGKRGLYLNTLFDLGPEFLRRTAPALELGRSFVRPEYQKNSGALHLLWKGIGAFLAQNPQYRNLIGPVSISNDYSKYSQRLLLNSLVTHHFHAGLAKSVKARHPLPKSMYSNWDALLHKGTILEIEEMLPLIENLEWDAKSVPVLLRHYLRLGGRIVSFHRDHSFSSCLDALVVVDVRAIEPRVLSKYLGTEGAQKYADHHGLIES